MEKFHFENSLSHQANMKNSTEDCKKRIATALFGVHYHRRPLEEPMFIGNDMENSMEVSHDGVRNILKRSASTWNVAGQPVVKQVKKENNKLNMKHPATELFGSIYHRRPLEEPMFIGQ